MHFCKQGELIVLGPCCEQQISAVGLSSESMNQKICRLCLLHMVACLNARKPIPLGFGIASGRAVGIPLVGDLGTLPTNLNNLFESDYVLTLNSKLVDVCHNFSVIRKSAS